jgi:hypothetical protein
MNTFRLKNHWETTIALICVCFLLFISACGGNAVPSTSSSTATPHTAGAASPTVQPSTQAPTPTPASAQGAESPASTATPIQGTSTPVSGGATALTINYNHPVLAFYYTWYTPSTWSSSTMSDLPMVQYTSSDDATIDQQVREAVNAGITGFISSWWGSDDVTDTNFAKLLAHAAALESATGYRFTSTIYFESDAPALSGTTAIVNALRYVITHYGNNNNFFHWHGKPVIFFWDPLGNGRTLATWASIRSQVDPHNQTIWSAEGVDTSLLSVFDGIHLFSAAYWGILHEDIASVDQGFRAKIDAYNQANHTQKIWAAGVLPGYDDTRVPGRKGTYIVPRNNGATYRSSWSGALASNPDWITITSFNEWFEGSMIEPSVQYGNLYLNITHQFAKQWHG